MLLLFAVFVAINNIVDSSLSKSIDSNFFLTKRFHQKNEITKSVAWDFYSAFRKFFPFRFWEIIVNSKYFENGKSHWRIYFVILYLPFTSFFIHASSLSSFKTISTFFNVFFLFMFQTFKLLHCDCSFGRSNGKVIKLNIFLWHHSVYCCLCLVHFCLKEIVITVATIRTFKNGSQQCVVMRTKVVCVNK